MKSIFQILSVLVLITSCTIAPEPINYNYDECAYCKMKISDVRFGAELVTNKGKIYKYDSAECLVRTYIENEDTEYSFVQVTDFSRPKELIDAASAFFLISPLQPSPMGGNLSAYGDKDIAAQVLSQKEGNLLSFNDLIENYKSRYK